MSGTKARLAALGAVFICGGSLASCGSGIPSNGVARVGDYVITRADFDHWMGVAARSQAGQIPGQAAAAQVPDAPNFTSCIAHKRATAPKPAKGQPNPTDAQFKSQCKSDYDGLSAQVMQFLISADWIQGEAADQGVTVSAKDAQKQFKTVAAQQFPRPADLQNFLAHSGMTMNDLLFRVRLDTLANKLRTKITGGKDKVTDAQIAAEYNKNKSRFAQPERRDLRVVLAKTPADANAALAAIRSGQNFATVAKRYSIDQASKSQGGVLLGIAKGQQEQALDAAIFAAKVGQLSGPIKTQFGYYVFRVQKITPASQQTLAQVKSTIKQQLALTGQQTALDAFVKKFRSKWTSRTDCRKDYTVASCHNYKAPKQPSIGGVPGGAGGVPNGGPPAQGGAGAPPSQGGAPPTGAPPAQGGAGHP